MHVDTLPEAGLSLQEFYYDFETDLDHSHKGEEVKTPIHYEHLTSVVFKRKIFKLPTTGKATSSGALQSYHLLFMEMS